VFTELIAKLGVQGVVVEEIYTLDQIPTYQSKPYGLIFLFKWKKNQQLEDSRPVVEDASDVFFAQQVAVNSCATQAIINILCNTNGVELGEAVQEIKNLKDALPPFMLGEAVSQNDVLREVHNSFAPPLMFDIESKDDEDEGEDVYHFVAYVPVGGKLYELDGLKDGPILVADSISEENWLESARTAIEQRVQVLAADGVHYALLSVEPDPLPDLKARAEVGDEAAKAEIQEIEEKRAQWTVENERRRFNYVPLIMALAQELADAGALRNLVEQAKNKATSRREALMKKKESAMEASEK